MGIIDNGDQDTIAELEPAELEVVSEFFNKALGRSYIDHIKSESSRPNLGLEATQSENRVVHVNCRRCGTSNIKGTSVSCKLCLHPMGPKEGQTQQEYDAILDTILEEQHRTITWVVKRQTFRGTRNPDSKELQAYRDHVKKVQKDEALWYEDRSGNTLKCPGNLEFLKREGRPFHTVIERFDNSEWYRLDVQQKQGWDRDHMYEVQIRGSAPVKNMPKSRDERQRYGTVPKIVDARGGGRGTQSAASSAEAALVRSQLEIPYNTPKCYNGHGAPDFYMVEAMTSSCSFCGQGGRGDWAGAYCRPCDHWYCRFCIEREIQPPMKHRKTGASSSSAWGNPRYESWQTESSASQVWGEYWRTHQRWWEWQAWSQR